MSFRVTWADIQNGERIARSLASSMFIYGMTSNALIFIRKSFRQGYESIEERFAFGIWCVAIATLMYTLGAVIQNFIGHDTSFAIVPVTAGIIMLLGYYQAFIAWRSAYVGKLNGFVWKSALAIFATFLAGMSLSAMLTSYLTN